MCLHLLISRTDSWPTRERYELPHGPLIDPPLRPEQVRIVALDIRVVMHAEAVEVDDGSSLHRNGRLALRSSTRG